MLAVDPDYQGGGIGTVLTEFALDRLKDAGMAVAMIETGGDPGHAAARPVRAPGLPALLIFLPVGYPGGVWGSPDSSGFSSSSTTSSGPEN